MFNILKALVTIGKHLARIREILEIAFAKELQYYEEQKAYAKRRGRESDSDREFDTKYIEDTDEYGEKLPEETDNIFGARGTKES